MIRRFCLPAPPLINEICRMRRSTCSTPENFALETHSQEVATLMRAFLNSSLGHATESATER